MGVIHLVVQISEFTDNLLGGIPYKTKRIVRLPIKRATVLASVL